MSYRVLIVGGAGEMGRWYAKFLKRAGWDVRVHVRNPNAERIAREGGWSIETDLSRAGEFDVVLISVPIDQFSTLKISNLFPSCKTISAGNWFFRNSRFSVVHS